MNRRIRELLEDSDISTLRDEEWLDVYTNLIIQEFRDAGYVKLPSKDKVKDYITGMCHDEFQVDTVNLTIDAIYKFIEIENSTTG